MENHTAGKPGTYTRNFPIDLPICAAERSGESIVDHGARVLMFLLETSCTATLSDRELQRTTGEKFETYAQAKTRADELNAAAEPR